MSLWGQHTPTPQLPASLALGLLPTLGPGPKGQPSPSRVLNRSQALQSPASQQEASCSGPCPAGLLQSGLNSWPPAPPNHPPPHCKEPQAIPGPLPGLGQAQSPPPGPFASGYRMPAWGWPWAPAAPPDGWSTWAWHHPAWPHPRSHSPAGLAGGALARGAFRGPLPLGAFAQPLEHGGKGRCWLGLDLAGSGVCPGWRLSWALARWGSWEPGGKAVSGRPLSAGEAWQLRMHPHSPTLTPAPAQPVWEERAEPEGGAPEPARLPEKVWTSHTHRLRGSQEQSHPAGEAAGHMRDQGPGRQTEAQPQGLRSG